ncbi:MAG: MaoC/PaaZ C-terminal domain-containing protein [Alphaproteobacteria bacterium]|jgi:acyl dehydratase|nr:MaoC/PaaZ C-terminal domain-containing protein [Alphaproteobacteria bacterium]
MSAHYFEDLAVGDRLAAGPYRVAREEMLAFAQSYDPRPVHLDDAAGAASDFGGLVASGIYTLAVWNRLRFEAEAGLSQIAGLGLEEVRYSAPVRAGDRLDLAAECTAKRPSASRADRGIMAFQHRLLNQHGQLAMTAVVNLLVSRRPARS